MNSLGAGVHRGGERRDVRRPADRRPVVGIVISLLGVLAIITKLDPGVLAHFAFNIGDIIILINMVLWGGVFGVAALAPADPPAQLHVHVLR